MTDRMYNALVGTDADGALFSVDAIKHAGKLWLVPSWLEMPTLGVSRPARIIRFDNQPHQHMPQAMNQGWPEYILNGPVPKALFDGPVQPGQTFAFEYVDAPEIDIPASIRPLGMKPN